MANVQTSMAFYNKINKEIISVVDERERERERFENKRKKMQNERWDTVQKSTKEYHWIEGLCLG